MPETTVHYEILCDNPEHLSHAVCFDYEMARGYASWMVPSCDKAYVVRVTSVTAPPIITKERCN